MSFLLEDVKIFSVPQHRFKIIVIGLTSIGIRKNITTR